MNKVWVDIDSGTWGAARSIRIVTLNDHELEKWEEMSDSSRREIATLAGSEVKEIK